MRVTHSTRVFDDHNVVLKFCNICMQAGIRCAAVADWTRACAYFKNSLEASILLYGKMDVRTISVAKLLHSARQGRSGEAADKGGDGGDGDEDDEAPGADTGVSGGMDGQEAAAFAAVDVTATPRTIEVPTTGEVNPTYREAVAKVSPKAKAVKTMS